MKTKFGHIQFNVEAANLAWYRDFYAFLGWTTWYGDDHVHGVGDERGVALWFNVGVNGSVNDHDGAGLNHIAMETESPADVDAAAEYLRSKGVELLYDTPCRRPEYESETSIYYSAMFESPDRILMEIVYSGPEKS